MIRSPLLRDHSTFMHYYYFAGWLCKDGSDWDLVSVWGLETADNKLYLCYGQSTRHESILPSQSLVAPTELLCGSHNELWWPECMNLNQTQFQTNQYPRVYLLTQVTRFRLQRPGDALGRWVRLCVSSTLVKGSDLTGGGTCEALPPYIVR